MPKPLQLVRLRVEDDGGREVFEEVLTERLEEHVFRLRRSPGLVLGLAAGDEIEVDEGGGFSLLKRAGNICIQVYWRGDLRDLEQFVGLRLKKIGGWIDGRSHAEIVCTVPISAGFQSVESVFNSAAQEYSGLEWYYGNVYDPVDGVTPLNWWAD